MAMKMMQNLKENSKFHRLKNSDFLLKSKMVELDPIKNYKKSDQPDVVWKLYQNLCEKLYLRNKLMTQLTKLFSHALQHPGS